MNFILLIVATVTGIYSAAAAGWVFGRMADGIERTKGFTYLWTCLSSAGFIIAAYTIGHYYLNSVNTTIFTALTIFPGSYFHMKLMQKIEGAPQEPQKDEQSCAFLFALLGGFSGCVATIATGCLAGSGATFLVATLGSVFSAFLGLALLAAACSLVTYALLGLYHVVEGIIKLANFLARQSADFVRSADVPSEI